MPARVPHAGEAVGQVAREIALPSVGHDVLSADRSLIVPKIGVVLVQERRADQVVPGRVGSVRKGSQMERDLAHLEVDVAPFRIRETYEPSVEPRLHRSVVIEEFGEHVDMVLNRSVGGEADAGGVERVLPEILNVDAVLIAPALPHQIQDAPSKVLFSALGFLCDRYGHRSQRISSRRSLNNRPRESRSRLSRKGRAQALGAAELPLQVGWG